MPKIKEKKLFSETQLYIDAVTCMRLLIETVKQLPRPIQYTMGEMAIKDTTILTQSMRLAYSATIQTKVGYIDKALERLACLEVTIVMLFECSYININRKAELYKLLGSMQKQSRAWKDKARQQTLSIDSTVHKNTPNGMTEGEGLA